MNSGTVLQIYIWTAPHRKVFLILSCPHRVSLGTTSLQSNWPAGSEPFYTDAKANQRGGNPRSSPLLNKAGQQSCVRHMQPMGLCSLMKYILYFTLMY